MQRAGYETRTCVTWLAAALAIGHATYGAPCRPRPASGHPPAVLAASADVKTRAFAEAASPPAWDVTVAGRKGPLLMPESSSGGGSNSLADTHEAPSEARTGLRCASGAVRAIRVATTPLSAFALGARDASQLPNSRAPAGRPVARRALLSGSASAACVGRFPGFAFDRLLEATGSIFEPDPATCAFRVAENEVRRRFLELREDVRAAVSPL
jgi:hypothetical protein